MMLLGDDEHSRRDCVSEGRTSGADPLTGRPHPHHPPAQRKEAGIDAKPHPATELALN